MPIYREKRISSGQTDRIRNNFDQGISIANKVLPPTEPANPPFDPRVTRLSGAGGVGGRLLRGRITQMEKPAFMDMLNDGGPTNPGGLPPGHPDLASGSDPELPGLRSVHFLYNPTEIGVNYAFDTDAVPPQVLAENTPPEVLTNSQTMSWRLQFNRTYEVASDPNHPGVMADVQAFEYILGTRDGQPVQYASPVMVIFGATGKMVPFAFTGYITSFTITYPMFSRRMVPIVAMVEVGMSRRFVGESEHPLSGVHQQPVEGALQPPGFSDDGDDSDTQKPRTSGGGGGG